MKECEVIAKMKTYAVQATQFIADIDFSQFSKDAKTTNACVFNLSQIGELVTKLSEKFIKDNSEIPWRKIKDMRNRIVHDYEGVHLNIVWEVLTEFLPELITNLERLS
ncbi:MAG: DUF86 domain-containing protein [Firmicutes bacterium]|nr:DUF86 domain-containing protein [Bacillota bacterium]